MDEVEISGVAALCFLADDSGFHGNLVTEDERHFSLVGKASDSCCHDYHTCCHETPPIFYDITLRASCSVVNWENVILRGVMRTGGDNCTLSSQELNFDTDELLVNQSAEAHITKYFSSKWLGRNCYVCVGPLSATLTLQNHADKPE